LGAFGALVSVRVVAAIAALIDTYGHRYELVGSVEEGEAAGSRPATDVPA
jgi:hypothetical protein